MTRDHKLILGGALCGGAGSLMAFGAIPLAVALILAGLVLIAAAGRAR